MSLLFSPIQNYAWSLEHARRQLDAEPRGEPANKVEHQINTRIYNNSFCGLLKKGYIFEIVKDGDVDFIQLEFDGVKYQCPEKTVSNILRADYERIKNKPGSVSHVTDEPGIEGPSATISELPIKRKSAEPPEAQISHSRQQGVKDAEPPNYKKNPLLRPVMFSLDDITFATTESREILEISPQTKISAQDNRDIVKDNDTRKLKPDELPPGSETGSLFNKMEFRGSDVDNKELITDEMLISKIQKFKPENLEQPDVVAPAKEESYADDMLKPRKRMFGLFGGAKNKNDSQTVNEEKGQSEHGITVSNKDINNITRNTEEGRGERDVKSSDCGELYQQIHMVRLKKQFGAESVGPYRFVFWPTRVIEKCPSKVWADFLVHITGPDNSELVACTDGGYKELLLTMDGKEFNIFATWDSGVYESHVTLRGKTASVYAVEEEVRGSKPRLITDSYFGQFRCERKGQPKHFVVPFKASNCGEENIPIVGYVEVGQKKYPLERMEGNTLRYKYAGTERKIRGHWENGCFIFDVEDVHEF